MAPQARRVRASTQAVRRPNLEARTGVVQGGPVVTIVTLVVIIVAAVVTRTVAAIGKRRREGVLPPLGTRTRSRAIFWSPRPAGGTASPVAAPRTARAPMAMSAATAASAGTSATAAGTAATMAGWAAT